MYIVFLFRFLKGHFGHFRCDLFVQSSVHLTSKNICVLDFPSEITGQILMKLGDYDHRSVDLKLSNELTELFEGCGQMKTGFKKTFYL